MRAVIPLLLAALPGCMCGPPAEPLIDVLVDTEVAPAPDDYLHLDMVNPTGETITGYGTSAIVLDDGRYGYLLGNCDGSPQMSGTFALRAWLDKEPWSGLTPQQPDPDEPQGVDHVEVRCDDDGCYADRAARIVIRP